MTPLAHGVQAAADGPGAWLLPLLLSAVLSGAYAAAAVRYRRLRRRAWSAPRTAAFLAGVAVLGWALSPAGESLLGGDARGHMVQHLAIGMLAPLGLVLGAPATLLLGVGSTPLRHRVAALLSSRAVHALAHPLPAALLSVGSMYLLYLTPLYAASTERAWLHHALHLHFLLAGCLFTWAIAGPDPTPRRPRFGVRVVMLVLAGAAHGHLAKLLYARAGELPPAAAHGAAEVEAAAQWMFYGGDVAELLLAVALFAAWYRRGGVALRRQRPNDSARGRGRLDRAGVRSGRPATRRCG